MENLYIININTLPDPIQCPEAMKGLSELRKRRCLKYFGSEDRKRCLGAGRIMKHILNDKPIHISETGKPIADGICFNISHSGDYVIGVSSKYDIGCDIEKISTGSIYVAEKYFFESENSYIMSQADKDKAFKKIWTLKESYLKMTGDGVAHGLKNTEIIIDDKIRVLFNGKLQECTLGTLIIDNHMIAVCSQNKKFNMKNLTAIYI